MFDQAPELREIRRGKHGWREVFVFSQDKRLFIARSNIGWFFAVNYRQRWEDKFHLQEGPFNTQGEAEAKARRWFIDNPDGDFAQLLARGHRVEELRNLAHNLNDGDPLALSALLDLARETDANEVMLEWVEHQLLYLGVVPCETT
jgi:hypothetical protein